MKSAKERKKPKPNGLRPGEEFCLANQNVFFWAALHHWDYMLQGLVDGLFPKEGYHLDDAIMEATFLKTGYVRGRVLDSLSIDRKRKTLFNIEMQLYELEQKRPLEYYNAIRRKADVGKGFGVPIEKIYIIFCCDKDPMKGKGRPPL